MNILVGYWSSQCIHSRKQQIRVKILYITLILQNNPLENCTTWWVTYTDQKLSKKLQIKVENQHKHDLVYDSKCLEPTCNEDYLGETGSRILESSADNWGKYKQSHLLRHALNSNHKTADMRDFKIIDFSYHNNRLKGKIWEALHIKQYKPSLNTQEQSVQLKLFN